MWVEALGETPSSNESFIKFGQAAAETRESDNRGHKLPGAEKSLVHSVHFIYLFIYLFFNIFIEV